MSDDFRSQLNQARADIERGLEHTKAQLEHTKAQFDATQERINARTGRNLLGAIGIGLAAGGLLLASLLLWKPIFVAFGVLVVGLAAWELSAALRTGNYRVPLIVTSVSAAAVLPITWVFGAWGQFWGILGAMVVSVVARLILQARPAPNGRRSLTRDLSATVFVHAYITALGSCAVLLASEPRGEWWTLTFIIVVILTDTGAYASGLAWGRHPMAPVISPKKTWEGFAGGAAAALLGGVLLGWLVLDIGPGLGLVFGALIFLTATLGDLAESLVKRDLGIKDMSSWLPGHGGFLDRLDSILPSAAVAYACYLVMTF
ncbi:MAG TPA: phosphatidate cytidylyltransferase [Microbacteriaceae bacterium]|nr:phosphatidate cytidylyltransferase [Microbacteriaceae bacterium]